MAIEELQCHEFRNLKNTSLRFNSKLNIIIGSNGSGKTSLLESIYILSTSKSFRTKHLNHCIQHNNVSFVLFAQYNNHSIGIKKEILKFTSKINNKYISKRSDIAKLQSAIVIDSASFDLVNGTKQKRREFLDWALFHVKQSFSLNWVKYKKTLKQRNYLLKNKQLKEIKYWDEQLIIFNEEIHQDRKSLLIEFNELFKKRSKNFEYLDAFKINYKQGWKQEINFKDALDSKLNIDLKRGFTSVGNQKCDLQFTDDGREIKEVYSRGQIKRLVILMYLTLVELVEKKCDIQPIFIIDDLVSELDQSTIKDVIVSLTQNNNQIFISNIEYDDFLKQLNVNKTVFHVKHGEINQQE